MSRDQVYTGSFKARLSVASKIKKNNQRQLAQCCSNETRGRDTKQRASAAEELHDHGEMLIKKDFMLRT
jgi:hypothetical protein